MNATHEVPRETWDAIYQLICGIPLGTSTFDVAQACLAHGEEVTWRSERRSPQLSSWTPVDERTPEAACLEKERAMVLLDELDEIDSCSRCVLSRLYGLDGGEPLSHLEVGNLFGLPESVVRRIEAQSLATLRPLLSEVA